MYTVCTMQTYYIRHVLDSCKQLAFKVIQRDSQQFQNNHSTQHVSYMYSKGINVKSAVDWNEWMYNCIITSKCTL